VTDIPQPGPGDAARAEQEFRQFYRANYDAVRRWVRWEAPDVDDEEIAADAFFKTWERWGRVAEPRPFVFRVARHGMLNGRRKARRQAPPVAPDDGHAALVPPPADGHTRREFHEALHEVDRLPPQLREAVKLDAFGLSIGEIAEVIGCGKKTVSNYLWQARQRLSCPGAAAGGDDRSGGSDPGGRQDRGDA